MNGLSFRIRLFLTHLAISLGVIGACVAFILIIWYPPPFRQFEAIVSILLLMAGVDICAGPLCTLVVASPKKTRAHLARDLAVIGSIQLIALGTAIYTTGTARPVFVVYSFGQFDVEHANELSAEELAKVTAPEYSSKPLLGPVYVEARLPDDPAEAARIVRSAMNGGPSLKDMPRYFRPWSSDAADARKRTRAVADLPAGQLREAIEGVLHAHGVAASDAAILPFNGNTALGTAVLRRSDLSILGIVPPAQ